MSTASSRRFFALAALYVLTGCGGPDTPSDGGARDAGGVLDAALADGAAGDGGTSTVVTRTIGASGGTLEAGDGIFSLIVPEGALSADTDISIRVLPETEWPAEASGPLGGVYEITPDGLSFAVPAYGVHRFATRPAGLAGTPDQLVPAIHVARSADGAVESVRTAMGYEDDGGVVIVGELPHLSEHWTERIDDDDVKITLPEERSIPVGSDFVTTSMHVSAPGATSVRTIAASLPANIATPIRHEGWSDADDRDASIFARLYGRSGAVLSTILESAAADLPEDGRVPPPLPAFHCNLQGSSNVGVGLVLSSPGTADVQIYTVLTISCFAPLGPPPLAEVSGPEAIRAFTVDPMTFAPAGLVEGREYLVTVSSAAPGGITLIDTVTGTATPNPGYSAFVVEPFRDAWGNDGFTVGGASGTATYGWNGLAPPDGPWGGRFLGASAHTTGIDVGALDASGVPARVLYNHLSPPQVMVRNSTGAPLASVEGAAFPGGAFPANPVSSALTPGEDGVIVALENGEVWFGPTSALGTPTPPPLTLVGGPMIVEPRFIRCFESSSDRNVCALAGYGDDTLYVYEVTDTEAVLTAMASVGDMPVDPAVVGDGADVLIAVGSGTNTLSMFRYAPATDVLTPIGTPTAIEGCAGPNHTEFGTAHALYVSCFVSGNIFRIADAITFVGG